MPVALRRIFAPAAAAFLVVALAAAGGVNPPSQPDDDNTLPHVLDRLGYGARPGDVEKVRRLGISSYIDQQLHPEKIDDSALAARLAPLTTIDLTTSEIAREYY